MLNRMREGRGDWSRVGRASVLASVVTLAACSGESQASGPAPGAASVEASEAKSTGSIAEIVARLETAAPEESKFRLHGTVPVPPGTIFSNSAAMHLAIVDSNGQPVETQVEVVSRYADENSGADVVEVIATVTRPSGAKAGDRLQYDLCRLTVPVQQAQTPADAVSALKSGATQLHPKVEELLSNPFSIGFRSRDVFGNPYFHMPLEAQNHAKVLRHGPEATQVRSYNVMWPSKFKVGATGPMPHLFGMHTYVTAFRDSEVMLVDLRVHNGFANTESNSQLDDPINRIYFDGLDFGVPPGWSVVQAFEDPGFGTPKAEGGYRVFPLIDRNEDGTMHVMPMGGQTVRRLAICPAGKEPQARRLLEQEGLAFAVDGIDQESGDRLWSWSNPETARYLPQNFPLPSLDHVGLGYLRAVHEAEVSNMAGEVASGGVNMGYPLQSGKLGWAHPFGVAYGGMTGGDEIHLFEGVDVVQAASIDGYRKLQLTHRLHTDRQPNVLYRRDGDHASLWDWYVENGEKSYIPMTFYMKIVNGNDPIGITTAPTVHVEAAKELEKVPAYEQQLLSFESHDLQHLIRYTRAPKALAWIGNDRLAIDDLFAQAELVRLSYHPYFSDPWGSNMTVTGLRADMEQAKMNPGGAVDFGRGEGWATDTRVAAYALANDEWRDGELPMLEDIVKMLAAAQTPCNGHIMAFWSSKILDGQWRVAQAYETSIVDNGIRGLLETALRGKSEGLTALTEEVLRDHYYGFIGPTAWSTTLNGPVEQYAVAPLGDQSTPYCGPEQQPANGQYPGINGYQTWCTLGFAYDLTKDPIFLQRAEQMIGGPLFEKMTSDGVGNLPNRVALLSVVQKLNGVL